MRSGGGLRLSQLLRSCSCERQRRDRRRRLLECRGRVAIKAGRIVAVGDDRTTSRPSSAQTPRWSISRAGRSFPGSTTPTPTPPSGPGPGLPTCSTSLPDRAVGPDIVAQVRAKAQTLPAGRVGPRHRLGRGLSGRMRRRSRFRLHRSILDAVSPDNPVALQDFSVHTLWVNSKALELAGIGRDTASPIGGGHRERPGHGRAHRHPARVRRRRPGHEPRPAAEPRAEAGGDRGGARRDERPGHHQHDRARPRSRGG